MNSGHGTAYVSTATRFGFVYESKEGCPHPRSLTTSNYSGIASIKDGISEIMSIKDGISGITYTKNGISGITSIKTGISGITSIKNGISGITSIKDWMTFGNYSRMSSIKDWIICLKDWTTSIED